MKKTLELTKEEAMEVLENYAKQKKEKEEAEENQEVTNLYTKEVSFKYAPYVTEEEINETLEELGMTEESVFVFNRANENLVSYLYMSGKVYQLINDEVSEAEVEIEISKDGTIITATAVLGSEDEADSFNLIARLPKLLDEDSKRDDSKRDGRIDITVTE